MATNIFLPNLRALKEKKVLALSLEQKQEEKKKKSKDKLIAERPNRTKRYQSAKELVGLSMHLESRDNREYVGKGKVIKTVTELDEFEKSVEPASEVWYTLNLKPNETYPNGLVAIDRDNPEVWERLTLPIKEGTINFKNPIINTTFRGGHIIYEADKLESTKVSVPLKAGFSADYLTSRVSILGPGKYISSIPENGTRMPVIVNFLKKHPGLKAPPILNGLQIIEGFRNDTIFKWVSGKLDCDIETRKAIARLLGRYFCNPPLDIRECMSLVKENSENTLEEEEEIYVNATVDSNVLIDIELMHERLKDKFTFDETVGQFYKFTGTYWRPITEEHMVSVVEFILLDSSNRFKCRMAQHATRTVARTHANRSKHYLSVPDEWRHYLGQAKQP